MLIHSTQTELILAACCLAAWPASVNIRQLDHCDRGITVLHGTTLLAITNLLHIFLQERLWASAAAVAFCRLVTSIMFNSRAQKLKRHLGDEAVILQGLHRDISRSSKRRTKLLKPSEDSIIYIYIHTYIVLNTHTYTRMCIYIYIYLSLSLCACMDVLNSAVSRTNSTCYTLSQDISGEQCASDVRVVEPQIRTGKHGKTIEENGGFSVAIWLAIRIYQRVCQLDSTGMT